MNINDFDYKFYLELYPDLRHLSIENAYRHYIGYGKNEGRICNRNLLKNNISNAYLKIENENNNFVKKKTSEERINILIRTSNRPDYFKECINSILTQDYNNYNVIICFDKKDSLDYLMYYQDYEKIDFFYIEVESKEKYKFNLYCNILMSKVESGWIMFLDDDDKLTHNKVLSIINENIEDENIMYIWKFLRPDKIIYPNECKIFLGNIDTTSVCFHNNIKNNSKWIDKQYGDYNFYKEFKNEKKLIDYILTQTIDVNKIGNFGN